MIIFFDGECNLCNGFIDWLIRLDKKKRRFQFASLQGQTAIKLGLSVSGDKASVIVYKQDQFYHATDAIVQIGLTLGGVHALGARVFALIPRHLRESLYFFVARNRYRVFGKRDSCRLPTPEEKAYFLD